MPRVKSDARASTTASASSLGVAAVALVGAGFAMARVLRPPKQEAPDPASVVRPGKNELIALLEFGPQNATKDDILDPKRIYKQLLGVNSQNVEDFLLRWGVRKSENTSNDDYQTAVQSIYSEIQKVQEVDDEKEGVALVKQLMAKNRLEKIGEGAAKAGKAGAKGAKAIVLEYLPAFITYAQIYYHNYGARVTG